MSRSMSASLKPRCGEAGVSFGSDSSEFATKALFQGAACTLALGTPLDRLDASQIAAQNIVDSIVWRTGA
ncbi:MAG: hypothetical protein ACI81L_001655 [Verrucomicrobiales bacterium]|jgi:hypothetical protein